MKRVGIALLLGAVLALGCGWRMVRPELRKIDGAYSVHPQIAWSGIGAGKFELWTIHGPQLEALRLSEGLEDGEAFFSPTSSNQELPEFRSGMNPVEIAEFVAAAFTRAGAARVVTDGLRPADFGGRAGFRFELDFATDAGLEMDGLAAGAVVDQKLYLIVFTAPRGHFYERNVETVEKLLGSVRFP